MKERIIRNIIICILVIGFTAFFVIKHYNNENINIKGKVIDIYSYEDNYKRPIILIEKNNEPYSVTFKKDIDIEKLNIDLSDTVSIKTDGIVRESYPMQITGYDIKVIKKTKKDVNEDVKYYNFNAVGSYDEDMKEFDYHAFKTKVFYSMKEYLGFASTRGININFEDELNEMLDDKVIVVCYGYMSSTPVIKYSKTYNLDKTTFIELNIKSTIYQDDDIPMRGMVLIMDKDYIKDNIVTLNKYIVLK